MGDINSLDEACEYGNIVTELKEIAFDTILSNNFAFSRSNSTMIVRKYTEY